MKNLLIKSAPQTISPEALLESVIVRQYANAYVIYWNPARPVAQKEGPRGFRTVVK